MLPQSANRHPRWSEGLGFHIAPSITLLNVHARGGRRWISHGEIVGGTSRLCSLNYPERGYLAARNIGNRGTGLGKGEQSVGEGSLQGVVAYAEG